MFCRDDQLFRILEALGDRRPLLVVSAVVEDHAAHSDLVSGTPSSAGQKHPTAKRTRGCYSFPFCDRNPPNCRLGSRCSNRAEYPLIIRNDVKFVWSPLKAWFGWAVFSTVARWRGAREFFLERLGRQDDEGLLPLLALSVELIDNNAPDLHERDVLRRTPIGRAAVRLIERNGIEHGLKISDARRVEISA